MEVSCVNDPSGHDVQREVNDQWRLFASRASASISHKIKKESSESNRRIILGCAQNIHYRIDNQEKEFNNGGVTRLGECNSPHFIVSLSYSALIRTDDQTTIILLSRISSSRLEISLPPAPFLRRIAINWSSASLFDFMGKPSTRKIIIVMVNRQLSTHKRVLQ